MKKEGGKRKSVKYEGKKERVEEGGRGRVVRRGKEEGNGKKRSGGGRKAGKTRKGQEGEL